MLVGTERLQAGGKAAVSRHAKRPIEGSFYRTLPANRVRARNLDERSSRSGGAVARPSVPLGELCGAAPQSPRARATRDPSELAYIGLAQRGMAVDRPQSSTPTVIMTAEAQRVRSRSWSSWTRLPSAEGSRQHGDRPAGQDSHGRPWSPTRTVMMTVQSQHAPNAVFEPARITGRDRTEDRPARAGDAPRLVARHERGSARSLFLLQCSALAATSSGCWRQRSARNRSTSTTLASPESDQYRSSTMMGCESPSLSTSRRAGAVGVVRRM